MKQFFLTSLHSLWAFFAKKWIAKHQPTVIGITGSVGKTSCRMVVTQVLQKLLPNKTIYTSPKNFNSELGLVFSLFCIEQYTPSIMTTLRVFIDMGYTLLFAPKSYDIIVLEYGIDHPGDMNFLTAMVQPDYSIFTKLDSIHAENFKNTESIWDEKFVLMQYTKKHTYLNASDTYCASRGASLVQEQWVDIVWYNGSWIDPQEFHITQKWQSIVSEFLYQNTSITTNLIGEENSFYIALGIDLAQEIWWQKIPHKLHIECELQPWRSSVFEWKHHSIIFDSSYNAGPASMKKMIENTQHIRDTLYPEYTLACIIWDMRELGGISTSAHNDIWWYLDDFDTVYTIWPEMKQHLPIPHKTSFLSSREAGKSLAEEIVSHPDKKYFILVKWSQNTIFSEEAVKELLNNPEDVLKLTRQGNDWMRKKEKFFWETDKTLA